MEQIPAEVNLNNKYVPSSMGIFTSLKEDLHALRGLLTRHKWKVILSLAILALSILLVDLYPLFWLIIFIILGGVSMIPQKYTAYQIGIELCTLFTIIAGMKFGPMYGAIVGLFSFTLGNILTYQLGPIDFIDSLYYLLLGIVSSFFSFDLFALSGILATIGFDIYSAIVYWLFGRPLMIGMIFYITHITINTIVFLTFSRIGLFFQ